MQYKFVVSDGHESDRYTPEEFALFAFEELRLSATSNDGWHHLDIQVIIETGDQA